MILRISGSAGDMVGSWRPIDRVVRAVHWNELDCYRRRLLVSDLVLIELSAHESTVWLLWLTCLGLLIDERQPSDFFIDC